MTHACQDIIMHYTRCRKNPGKYVRSYIIRSENRTELSLNLHSFSSLSRRTRTRPAAQCPVAGKLGLEVRPETLSVRCRMDMQRRSR